MADLVLSTNWRDKSTRRREALRAVQDHDPKLLKDLLKARLAADENSSSPYTLSKYNRAVDLWLQWLKPDPDASPLVLMHQADDDHVRDWLVWLRDDMGLQVSSRGVYLSGLRYLFKALVWARATSYNPADQVKKPSDRRHKMLLRKRVADDDLKILLDYLYGVAQAPRRRRRKLDGDKLVISNAAGRAHLTECLRDLVLVRLLYDGGARVSSAVGLELDDVHLQDDDPHIVFRNAKGRRSYPVPATDALAQAITMWLPFRAQYAPADSGPVLINLGSVKRLQGSAISDDAARASLQRLYKRAGIPDRYRGAHAFRHAAGADLIQKTDNLQLVKNWLGHTSIRTTSDTYADQTLTEIAHKAKGAFRG